MMQLDGDGKPYIPCMEFHCNGRFPISIFPDSEVKKMMCKMVTMIKVSTERQAAKANEVMFSSKEHMMDTLYKTQQKSINTPLMCSDGCQADGSNIVWACNQLECSHNMFCATKTCGRCREVRKGGSIDCHKLCPGPRSCRFNWSQNCFPNHDFAMEITVATANRMFNNFIRFEKLGMMGQTKYNKYMLRFDRPLTAEERARYTEISEAYNRDVMPTHPMEITVMYSENHIVACHYICLVAAQVAAQEWGVQTERLVMTCNIPHCTHTPFDLPPNHPALVDRRIARAARDHARARASTSSSASSSSRHAGAPEDDD